MPSLANKLPSLLVVGPTSPPAGGMAAQTEQLCRLLKNEALQVDLLQTNRAVGGELIQSIPVVRAVIRFLSYIVAGWRALGQTDVVHLMSNSGWSWQLYSAPILWMGRLRGVPVIVNYRGGGAEQYFSKSARSVRMSLNHASAIVVPSHFLQQVFSDFGYHAAIVPNIVDTERFFPQETSSDQTLACEFHMVVVRNLETIYGIDIALRAFALVNQQHPTAKLSIAGSGPELESLKALAKTLKVEARVHFLGRLGRDSVADLYRRADVLINSSRVDNMPNSLLEAMASGVAIVSTRAGGIPFLVEDGQTASLVDIDDVDQMAKAMVELLVDSAARQRLRENALQDVKQYQWSTVKTSWLSLYQRLAKDHDYRADLPNEGGLHLYTRWISNIVFPLQERVKKHTSVPLRQSLEMTQWLSPEQLSDLRVQKLRCFLSEIYETTDYFKRLFDSLDFNPKSFHSLDDLCLLPLMSKADIRNNTAELMATTATALRRFSTGGSSGNPLVFCLDNERISHDVAAKWRATRWWNVDIGDPEMVVWGSPIELGAQDRLRQLRDKLYRTQLFSAFDMSDATLSNACEALQSQRPSMVFGYPSVISSIARFAKEKGVNLSGLGVSVVFVTAERLYPEQRLVIESAFGCRVANGYGGRDSGFIAHECPQGSLHISAEDIIVEIVDDEGRPCETGVQGNIVVTHLATRHFPFVRYQTGDVGVLSDERCACGRGLPTLKDVVGRSSDFVVAQDGRKLHGAALTYVLREIAGIEGFKIVQKTKSLVHVNIVKGAEYQSDHEEVISREFSRRLGDGLQCIFDYPSEIAPEKSGKYRYIICEVSD